jgi:hypothetical protein
MQAGDDRFARIERRQRTMAIVAVGLVFLNLLLMILVSVMIGVAHV